MNCNRASSTFIEFLLLRGWACASSVNLSIIVRLQVLLMKYMSICTTANGPSGRMEFGVCVNGLWGCLSYIRVRQVSQFFIIFVIMSLFNGYMFHLSPYDWYLSGMHEFRVPDHEDS